MANEWEKADPTFDRAPIVRSFLALPDPVRAFVCNVGMQVGRHALKGETLDDQNLRGARVEKEILAQRERFSSFLLLLLRADHTWTHWNYHFLSTTLTALAPKEERDARVSLVRAPGVDPHRATVQVHRIDELGGLTEVEVREFARLLTVVVEARHRASLVASVASSAHRSDLAYQTVLPFLDEFELRLPVLKALIRRARPDAEVLRTLRALHEKNWDPVLLQAMGALGDGGAARSYEAWSKKDQ